MCIFNKVEGLNILKNGQTGKADLTLGRLRKNSVILAWCSSLSGLGDLERERRKMRSEVTCTHLTLLTVSSILVQSIGVSLFLAGFFPLKPPLSAVSGPESFDSPLSHRNDSVSYLPLPPPPHLKSFYQELSGIPPSFDRLVLMVIDGLPAEFLLGKKGSPPRDDLLKSMPYTHSLLSNGNAVGFHAIAAPPTVTMPRLKAMVSGAIGGFLDVAFNFNTQAMLDDNLLGQFFKIGWRMVMLGDETWLRLFPGLFTRHDGVSSFYVKDTVQVDRNVSRHLENELNCGDWDLLILHYLGLDHVGHIGGRNSVLIAPKLKEMDEVVKMIHLSTIQTQDTGQGRTLLVVASDHGMTENGNHGGSSYEETDSLALFIGLKTYNSSYASATHNSVYQVDIAPTLALLFGVPIPKNNVGVLISETLGSLTDDEKLRALELNSWQLIRLLQAQLPGLSCGNSPFDEFPDDLMSRNRECSGGRERTLCCLYMKAADLHSSWKSKISGSNSEDEYNSVVVAYYEFLKTTSEWSSRRVTDKPIVILALGIVAMALSCLILAGLCICMDLEVFHREKQHLSNFSNRMPKFCLDEIFTMGVVLIVVMSMGSSSMIEEEQYIWHFMLSTLFLLLLRKTVQSFPEGSAQSSLFKYLKRQNKIYFQVCSIVLLLFSGRILRGWHQGGVNWTYLPDISKWIVQAWGDNLRYIQLTSGFLVISSGIFALTLLGSTRKIVQLVGCCVLISGLLVIWHIMEYQHNEFATSSYGATLLVQIIYVILAVFTVSTVLAIPWFMPIGISGEHSRHAINSSTPVSSDIGCKYSSLEFRDSSYLIGLAYILFWCLLQLLLQQPVNSMPILLMLVQILATTFYYSYSGPVNKEWVEVASLYYLGMAGHFALGNSNTLATIDVAGAYIGLSSHSTLLSGILMFIITYASPMLFLLSTVMYNSAKDTSYLTTSENVDLGHLLKTRLGFPCLVPLCLNSFLLTAYTIVLLLLRNHLFIWSVFSPKYLYVCATTVCMYVGVFVVAATETYTCSVLILRRKRQVSISNGFR